MSFLIGQQMTGGYGAADILHDCTIGVDKGEIAVIVGPNGAGKSTLLRCLAGRAEPTVGGMVRARGLRTALVLQETPEGLMSCTPRAVALAALPEETRDWEAWRADVALD